MTRGNPGAALRAALAVLLAALLGGGLPPPAVAQPRGDIIDTLAAAGSFRYVLRAIRAAGFVSTLKGRGPFTLFAPYDAAFDALPPGVFAMVMNNKRQITGIVAYHVAPGRLVASVLSRPGTIRTLEGESLSFTIAGGTRRVNDARILRTDLMTTNGVIHVINKVLVPRAR